MWWFAVALAADRPRGVRPAATTAEVLGASIASRRVAVLVGVDGYTDPEVQDLLNAAHDAEELGAILADPASGGFDQVKILAGTEPRDVVLDAFRDVTRDLRRDDVLVVYFSGHGTRVGPPVPVRYLLTSDSRPADLPNTAIELEALQRWFYELTPSRKVLIVDACFDGSGKSALPPTGPPPGSKPLTPPAGTLAAGEVYLFATTEGRPALEDDVLGHGVYTYYLLDALSWSFREADLDRDGTVTAWEAHDYARQRTIERSGGLQIPEAAIRVVGSADVVLSGNPTARAASDQALVYLYAAPTELLSGGTLSVDGRVRGTLPGTIPVSAGRHWFELLDRTGTRVAQGSLRVRPGRPIAANDLASLLAGPAFELTVGPTVWSAPAMSASFEGPVWGTELAGTAGWSVFSAGVRVAGLVAAGPRPLFDVGVDLGVHLERGPWRFAARAGPAVVWLPPTGDPAPGTNPYLVPDQAGWVFGSLGGVGSVGRTVADWLAIDLALRPGFTSLDLDGDLRATPVGTIGGSVSATWLR